MITEGEKPSRERVEALLTLVVDDDDQSALKRIQEALSIGQEPDEADVELYYDLWDTFGPDVDTDDKA
jgi:hypothetical protein